MKSMKPGEMFNKFQSAKGKLRSPEAVVASEQKASNKFAKSPMKKKTVKKVVKKGKKVIKKYGKK